MKYEDWEEAYEHPLEQLPWELGRPRPHLVELLKSGRVKKGKALDICCGAGTNTVYIAQQGFEVTGIDISKKAIAIAKQKAHRANVKIRFDVGNSVYLPYEDEEFVFVNDIGCFHHIYPEDRTSFIKGVYRVLVKSGVYFLTCFSDRMGTSWNRFSEKQIRDLFSQCFDIESLEHFGSVEGDGKQRHFWAAVMAKV